MPIEDALSRHYLRCLSDAASSIIDFTTRQALQRVLEQRSGGRLHLDPPPS